MATLSAVLAIGVASAGAQAPDPEAVLDHFRCYVGPTIQGDLIGGLGVRDQFGVDTISSAVPLELCNPVRKSVAGPPPGLLNPDAHLVCYREEDPAPFVPRTVRVTNQFGVDVVQVLGPFTLCTPASKAVQEPGTDPVDPPPLDDIEQRLDHFRCYRASGGLVPPPVMLADQFVAQQAFPSPAGFLCNPVEKQRPGFPSSVIGRPYAHLVCYPLFGTEPSAAPTVATRNQFGILRFFEIDASNTGELCVPSLKEEIVEPPRVAQHFRAYTARGGPATRTPVTFIDQFGTERVRLGAAQLLMTPVEKRRGDSVDPIERPEEHLKCYAVRGPEANRTVTITNQFGDATVVTVGSPTHRCAPAAKALEGDPGEPPADLNHYKCYAVSTTASVDEVVGLSDQFGSEQVRVVRLRRLCNPVEKRRDERPPEPPPHPAEHLACYQIREARGFQLRTVFTRDQFGDETLEVSKPSMLCVPSEKSEGGGET